ncbi:MAG: extracellular solute-binding protein [Clostridia bacterium]|nr:extracellular solute-binding protein [Clostridia bacterium]
MESNVGIDIDLFFGGGQYEIEKQARKGYAVDAGLLRMHPEWFNDDVIPRQFSGEVFYDLDGRYYGACLATFGMCYNGEYSEQLGVPAPRKWRDMGKAEFFGTLAVADPTKSGSINKCFEMIIQQMMADAIRAAGTKTAEALDQGWADGLNLIKRIGANSRCITDAAGKVPRDVAKGDAAAGMCIDFYGRTEAEWAQKQNDDVPRLFYVTPVGGSSVSADPIMLFRGAPNRDAAIMFIEFVLSKKGQRIWNARLGTPGGPKTYALRRLSVRKDMYVDEERALMSDPDAAPFSPEEEFNYDTSLTARYFSLIRVIIKIMVIDPLPELQKAWEAIINAKSLSSCSSAMEAFDKLPFAYSDADAIAASLNPSAGGNTPLLALKKQREMTEFFRKQYMIAASLAESCGGK